MSETNTVVTDPSRKMKSSSSSSIDSSIRRVYPAKLAKEGISGLVAAGFFNGTRVDAGPYGDETFILLTGIDGTKYEVKNGGNLLARLTEVSEGTYVEITYNGKKAATKGKLKGKELHNWFVDSEA